MADDTQENVQEATEEAVETVETAQEEAVEAVEEAKEEAVAEVKEEANTSTGSAQVAEEPKKAAKAVSANLEKIIESIETLSVLELADLVHALEDRFGVSAAAPVAVAAAGAAPAAGGEAAEEKTSFNVILANAGANKIGAIKAVREIVPTLGLKEAKDLVESAPKPVLEGVNKATADEAKEKLTAAGATVELQ